MGGTSHEDVLHPVVVMTEVGGPAHCESAAGAGGPGLCKRAG